MSVGRKVGDAVERNEVKRLLREAFWALAEQLPTGFDYVIVARAESSGLAERERLAGIQSELTELIEKLGLAEAEARVSLRGLMIALLLAPVRLYRKLISPATQRRCKYEPSCSQYATNAIQDLRTAARHGAGGLAAAALQPVQPRRLRPGQRTEVVPMTGQLAAIFFIQWLEDAASALMKFLHDDVGFGWGMSIVGLTVIVRLALLPLTMKQIKSMNAMRALQPQMKEIQEKYKDDRQRQQQEMMKFYRENNVNPLASCLPLVLQLPVFIALFQVLKNGGEMNQIISQSSQPGWLFIPNLAEKATGGVLVALLIMYVLSQLASSVVMASASPGNQKFLMYGLPFIFIPIAINFPAGLLVYWITTNLWTFGQQVVVRRIAPPVPVAAAAGAGATAALADGGGGGAVAKAPPPPPKKKKRRRR